MKKDSITTLKYHRLKSGLKYNQDFVLVSEHKWKQIKNKFGGGPIIRLPVLKKKLQSENNDIDFQITNEIEPNLPKDNYVDIDMKNDIQLSIYIKSDNQNILFISNYPSNYQLKLLFDDLCQNFELNQCFLQNIQTNQKFQTTNIFDQTIENAKFDHTTKLTCEEIPCEEFVEATENDNDFAHIRVNYPSNRASFDENDQEEHKINDNESDLTGQGSTKETQESFMSSQVAYNQNFDGYGNVEIRTINHKKQFYEIEELKQRSYNAIYGDKIKFQPKSLNHIKNNIDNLIKDVKNMIADHNTVKSKQYNY